MQYRELGRTGIQVSSLCLGTWLFGSEVSPKVSAAMFHRCRDAGINFVDTADDYGNGRSEQVLSDLIATCRDEIILASKAGFPVGGDVNAQGLSRRHLMLALEASLRRLKTDRLDLFYLHRFDLRTPIEESLRALDDLVHQGKVLHPAVSNWAAWQIAKALGISAMKGLARLECIQPMYNLVKRQAEVEILPLAQEENLGVVAYSPLGGGLLSGKYGVTFRPSTGRLVDNPVYARRYGERSYYETAERLVAHARERGVHPGSLAIAWVMSHPAVTAPIIGARTVEQLELALAALEINMTREWRALISTFSPEPPPPTDRLEEKRQPG